MDVMCALHDSDEYGLLRWTLKDIATAIGAPIRILNELVTKGVLKGSDKVLVAPYIYVPRSGRKEGAPVTLVSTQDGPVWYSSRMVKDEYIRTIRGDSTRFGAAPDEAPKTPLGEANSDGSSTSSPSSSPPSGESEAPTLGSSPTKPPVFRPAPEESLTDRFPTANARRIERIQAWINAMNPSWKKRPSWTRMEQQELMGVLRFVDELTDTDWRKLRAYMHCEIPPKEEWQSLKLWQPDQRGQFVRTISDVLGHMDKWETACRRRNITIDLGGEQP